MKKLYVPGKVWLDVNAFMREFPQTKLPLVMLLGDSLVSKCTLAWIEGGPKVQIGVNGIMIGGKMSVPPEAYVPYQFQSLCGGGFPSGIDEWAYGKKIETYRDIVRGALSPEFPLTIKFQPNPDIATGRTLFSFAPIPCNLDAVTAYRTGAFLSLSNLAHIMWIYMTDFSMYSCANVDQYMNKYCGSGSVAAAQPGCVTKYCLLTYKDRMIDDFASRGFKYFEAKSQSEYKQYNEVYA